MSTYGIDCWYRPECRSTFNVELAEGQKPDWDAIHEAAGRVGWVIGHSDGQGHYACADHAETLFDPQSLSTNPKASHE